MCWWMVTDCRIWAAWANRSPRAQSWAAMQLSPRSARPLFWRRQPEMGIWIIWIRYILHILSQLTRDIARPPISGFWICMGHAPCTGVHSLRCVSRGRPALEAVRSFAIAHRILPGRRDSAGAGSDGCGGGGGDAAGGAD